MVFNTESEVLLSDVTNNASGIQDDSLTSGIGFDWLNLMNSSSSVGSSQMPDTLVLDDYLASSEAIQLSITDEVSSADPLDSYSLNINGASEVEITLSGLSADADLYLVRDENNDGIVDLNETIEASALEGAETEVISSIVDAGNYFVEVEQFEGDTSYNIDIEVTPFNVPTDEAGDDFETAFDLEGLETSEIINEFIGNLDPEDYYQIDIDEAIDIDVTLSGLTSDADLFLVEDVNGDGELEDAEYLLESLNEETEDDAIATTLFPGEYFLLVSSVEGNTAYTLDATASTFSIGLGELGTTSQSNTGFVGVTNPVETYQFTLSESSLVQLDLNNLSDDADLALYAESDGDIGEELEVSQAGSADSEQILEELDPGTYYVQVEQFSGDTQYTLGLQATLGATAPPDPEELSDAIDLGTFANSANLVSQSDAVSEAMPFDTYRFEVASTSQVELGLSNLTADADLYVYQDLNGDLEIELDDFEDPELVDFSNEAEDADENLDLILEPGVYYARVEQFEPSDETDYTLSLGASPFTPPEDTVGNSAAEAFDLGLLEGEFSTTEFVGDPDSQDFYQFTLDEASNITLALEGLGADADLYLYQDGEEIAFSESVGYEEEFIGLEDVAAGTYAVEVSQFAGNTNYTLELTQENFVPEGQLEVISNSFSRVTGPNSTRLELTQTPRTFTDRVNRENNQKDYFAFTLTGEAKDFNATLTGLNADADLRLYQDDNNNGEIDAGERLSTSQNNDTEDEQITRPTLDAGTYIVEVSAFSRNIDIDYTLSVSGTPPQPQLVLPPITPEGVTRNGDVTVAEPLDLYQFTADTDLTNFRADLTGLGADVDLLLYQDANGDGLANEEELEKSEQGGNNDEAIALDTLTAGQYLVGVRGFDGAVSDYTLTVAGTPPAPVPAPTPTPTPTPAPQPQLVLPAITPEGVTRNGDVTAAEPLDLYQFTADTDLTNFRADLTGLGADVDLLLYKDENQNGLPDEEALSKSEVGGNNDEAIALDTLTAGQYLVGVRGFDGAASDYTLTVAGTPPAPAPTPTPTPTLPGALPTITPDGVTRNGNVTAAEPEDFYPFTANNDLANFQATLTGLNGDADLILYRDENQNGRGEFAERFVTTNEAGTNNKFIIRNPLPAGQYVLGVKRFGGTLNGVPPVPVVDYRLIVSGGVPAPAPITEVNAGTSITTAPEIRAIEQQLQGNVSDGSPDAFYRFTVTESGIFTADLNGLTADADVRLINDRNGNNAIDPVTRDANGYLHAEGVEVIAWPGDRGTNNERLRAFLQPGTYYLNVNSYNKSTTPYTITTGFTQTQTDPLALNVELDFQGNLGQDARNAVQAVADYWSTIVPYTTLPSAQTIRVAVNGRDQGGVRGNGTIIQASAGPNDFTKDIRGVDMPIKGTFDINTNPEATRGLGLGTGADRDLRSFFDTAFHEIGHVFTAIAVGNAANPQVIDKGTEEPNDAFYVFNGNGNNARQAYGELLGTYQPTNIPVTDGKGQGSDFAHWQQETFGNEIFTHTDGPGNKDYLSILSVAYLKDYGFNVNYGAAEPYTLANAFINGGNG